MKDRITAITIDLLEELAGSGDIELSGKPAAETMLYGEGGELDSMGLVTLILALEQAVADEFGVNVALADEKALSQKRSPYRSVESVAEYTAAQVEGGT